MTGVGGLEAALCAVGAGAGVAVAVGPGGATVAREAEGKVGVRGAVGGDGKRGAVLVVCRLGVGARVGGFGGGARPAPRGGVGQRSGVSESGLRGDTGVWIVAARAVGQASDVEAAVGVERGAGCDRRVERPLQTAPADGERLAPAEGVGCARGGEERGARHSGRGEAPVGRAVVRVGPNTGRGELDGGSDDGLGRRDGDLIDEEVSAAQEERLARVVEGDAAVLVGSCRAEQGDLGCVAGEECGLARADDEGGGDDVGGGGGIAQLTAFQVERSSGCVAELEPLAGVGARTAPRSCHDFRKVEVAACRGGEDGGDAGAVRAGLIRGAGDGGGRVVAANTTRAVVGANGGELGEQGGAVDAAVGRWCSAGIGNADVSRKHGEVARVCRLVAVLGAVGACACAAVAVGPGGAGIAREAEGKVVAVGCSEGRCGELCLVLVVRRFGEGEAVPGGVGRGVDP